MIGRSVDRSSEWAAKMQLAQREATRTPLHGQLMPAELERGGQRQSMTPYSTAREAETWCTSLHFRA